MFILSLITLAILLCLLQTLPIVGRDPPLLVEHAHDSIMAYQEHGVDESDAAGYDINVLIKHSRMSRRMVSSSTNAAMELDVEENGGQSAGDTEDGGDNRDRLESWITEHVASADRELVAHYPEDEMQELRDEGKYSDVDDLSELEQESEEEREEEDGIDVFAIDWDNFAR